jgi:hypothetical protein
MSGFFISTARMPWCIGPEKSPAKFKLSPKEHPVGIQLCGTNTKAMAAGVGEAGCPGHQFGLSVKKVAGRRVGALALEGPGPRWLKPGSSQ